MSASDPGHWAFDELGCWRCVWGSVACGVTRCLIGVVVVLIAAACRSEDSTYSADEVQAAFRDAGVPVAAATRASDFDQDFGGVALRADLGSEFFVIVYDDDRDAKAAYETLRSQATRQSFDRIKRNVVVSGDELSPTERRRVAQALAQLSTADP